MGRVLDLANADERLLSYGTRKILINPNGHYQQRRAYDTDVTIADGQLFWDRWRTRVQGASAICRRDLNPGSYPFPAWQVMRLKQSQATPGKIGLNQVVEYVETLQRRNAKVSASVWIRPSVTTTMRLAVLSWSGTNNAALTLVNSYASSTYTLGNFYNATTYAIMGQVTLSCPANTWTRLELPNLTVPNDANNLNYFVITDSTVAQNVTIDVGGSQLEDGDCVTQFETVDPGIDLLRCQRFYEKSYYNYVPPGTATSQGSQYFLRETSSTYYMGTVYYRANKIGQPSTFQMWDTGGTQVPGGSFAAAEYGEGSATFAIGGPSAAFAKLQWAADCEI